MLVSEFVSLYPEFSQTPSAMLESALEFAEQTTSDTWGAKRQTIVGLTAASRLHASPFGRDARIDGKAPSNPYKEELRELQIAHACVNNRI